MTVISATHFPSLVNAQGRRFSTTWEKLLDRLAVPQISADKHDVPGISLATYRGDRRALANVEAVYAIGLDLDHLDQLSVHTARPAAGDVVDQKDWTILRRTFNATAAFVHSTWSSTMSLPRLRVFLLLSRPVNAEEYRRVYQATAMMCERHGFVVDRAASDPSRFWFLPSIPAEGVPYVFWTCTGAPIDVEAALRVVPEPPPPPAPTPRPLASTGGPSEYDRARAYLAKCPGAVSGSGGHGHTFLIASKVVRGFALSVDDAIGLMLEWNTRCSPPWSERDIRRKCEQAATVGRMNEGDMRDRQR